MVQEKFTCMINGSSVVRMKKGRGDDQIGAEYMQGYVVDSIAHSMLAAGRGNECELCEAWAEQE